jgi:3-hydroxybutyryl-CoA dehydrogenase
MNQNIEMIGIVGAGQMGNGIAQVAASKNLQVHLFDIASSSLEKAKKTIQSSLDRMQKKGSISEGEARETLDRIHFTSQFSDLAKVDIAIEAATENLDLKLKIFADLDKTLKPNCVLATNTSSISVTRIAAATQRPHLVAGMHFMNPVPIMKLVEGIRGLQTSDQCFDLIKKLSERLGKTFIASDKDMPGFIVNRILMPMINEAVYTLHEGIGTAPSIDEAMKLGCNHPMGPLQLADFIGLDTCLAIMNVLFEGLGDSKYRPCPLLIKYVEAGWLGKKSGRGFYNY